MDLATLIGLVGAFGIVIASMLMGGSVGMFVNIPSLLIVLVGTLFVVLMKFSLAQFLGAIKLATALSKEIAAGVLEVETVGRQITVRVKEHGRFPSGSADLSANFKPVLRIIQDVLRKTDGRIVVEGHSDDVPISTTRFCSNWALSSARGR